MSILSAIVQEQKFEVLSGDKAIFDCCGIYAIRNKVNGKFYIGSTIRFWKRWNEHRRALQHGKHDNSKLQRAWNKYSESEFIFEVIEVTEDFKQLVETEQKWIDLLQCCVEGIGYNLSPTAGSSLGLRFSSEARAKLCEQRKGRNTPWMKGRPVSEETRRKMSEANKGKSGQQMREINLRPESRERLRLLQQSMAKPYIVTSPEGKVIAIVNLSKFCKANNLHRAAMVKVAQYKQTSHKGWYCQYLNASSPPEVKLKNRKEASVRRFVVTNPNKESWEIENLMEFCKVNDLDFAAMYRTIGSKKKKTHKGWSCSHFNNKQNKEVAIAFYPVQLSLF